MVPQNQFYNPFLCLRHPVKKYFKTQTFIRTNKCTLSGITFYLEDDDHEPVNFHNETISFTCEPIKI